MTLTDEQILGAETWYRLEDEIYNGEEHDEVYTLPGILRAVEYDEKGGCGWWTSRARLLDCIKLKPYYDSIDDSDHFICWYDHTAQRLEHIWTIHRLEPVLVVPLPDRVRSDDEEVSQG